MAERGPYRAVKTVLLDGPDFQELPERARWVFVALKLSFGPSGIEVHYPQALAHELAAKTGASAGAVKDALDTLESTGWIRREGNVLWIVGQLEHDPHMQPTNKRHRTSIQRHIASLPRLAIVRSYMECHPAWFGDAPDSLSHSLPDSPKITPRITDNRIPSTEKRVETNTDDKSSEAAGAAPTVENSSQETPATEPHDLTQIDDEREREKAYLQHFMPLLRELEYDLSGSAGRTQGSIVKRWARSKLDPADGEAVIRGLRILCERGALGFLGLEPGDLLGLRPVNVDSSRINGTPLWTEATSAYYGQQGRDRGAGMDTVGDVLRQAASG